MTENPTAPEAPSRCRAALIGNRYAADARPPGRGPCAHPLDDARHTVRHAGGLHVLRPFNPATRFRRGDGTRAGEHVGAPGAELLGRYRLLH